MTRSWRFALVAAAVLGPWSLEHSVRGDVVQTQSIPFTDTNWDSSTSSKTEPLVFQQFDPSAHPTQFLKEVDISVSLNTTNTYSITFTSPSTISVSAITPPDPNNPNAIFAPTVSSDTSSGNWPLASFAPSLHVQDPNGLLTKTATVTTGPFPQTLDSAALGGPVNFGSTFNSSLLSSDADFAKFVGSGSISFPFWAQGISTFSSSTGNGSGFVTTQAGVTMTVTYITGQKQVVPEPASVVLLGLGAGGLLVARRWRSARKASAA